MAPSGSKARISAGKGGRGQGWVWLPLRCHPQEFLPVSPNLHLCYHGQDPALVSAPDISAHLHPASPLGNACSKKQQRQDTLQLLAGTQSNSKSHMGTACPPRRHRCSPFCRHVRT